MFASFRPGFLQVVARCAGRETCTQQRSFRTSGRAEGPFPPAQAGTEWRPGISAEIELQSRPAGPIHAGRPSKRPDRPLRTWKGLRSGQKLIESVDRKRLLNTSYWFFKLKFFHFQHDFA